MYADTDDRIRPIRPVKADSIVVKTRTKVLCQFLMKKRKLPTRKFKNIYPLVPLSTPVSCRWTVTLSKYSRYVVDFAINLAKKFQK